MVGMSNGSVPYVTFLVLFQLFGSGDSQSEDIGKTRYEKIRELVEKNMYLVEPYLKLGREGMPKEFLDDFLKVMIACYI